MSIAGFRFYRAMQEQPAALARLLHAAEPVDLAADAIAGARHVYTIGLGSSYHAATAAAYMLRAAGIDASAWSAHDVAAYPPPLGRTDAALLFSHSGARRYGRAAIERVAGAGAPLVVVTGSASEVGAGDLPMNSTTLRTTGPEPSEVATASYTGAMLLAARIAETIHAGSTGDLSMLPVAVAEALGLEATVGDLAAHWHDRRLLLALGAGPRETSAREAALKIAEAARRPVQAVAVEQFLHGLQAPVHEHDAALIFAGTDAALERTRDATRFLVALGVPVGWVSAEEPPAGAEWLRVADPGPWLAPIVEAVPAQLLAGHLAARAGVDADILRMDDARFAAAWEGIER